jgi:hypothetical protein
MSTKGMYLALFLAAVVSGCVLRLQARGVAGVNSAAGFGEVAGAIGVCFLVAAFVPTVLILVARRRTQWAASPTAVGMVVLAAFS